MDLKEPVPDLRKRAKSQPNIQPLTKENKRNLRTNKKRDDAPLEKDPKSLPPVPSILLEGEVLDADPDVPEIHRVVVAGNVERLKELIESGESVNAPDLDGWPPLHTAIKSRNYDCAQLLIKHGATDFFERQKEEYLTRHNLSARITKGRLMSF